MSDFNVYAQRWLSGGSPDSKYKRTNGRAFSLATPTGDPTDTIHSLYAKTPIGATIPPLVTGPPPISCTFTAFEWTGTQGTTSAAPKWTFRTSPVFTASLGAYNYTVYRGNFLDPYTSPVFVESGSLSNLPVPNTFTSTLSTYIDNAYFLELIPQAIGYTSVTVRSLPQVNYQRPALTISAFTWAGVIGSTSAAPRWSLAASGLVYTWSYTLYGGASSNPTTVISAGTFDGTAPYQYGQAVYQYDGPTVDGYYYKAVFTGANPAYTSLPTESIVQNTTGPPWTPSTPAAPLTAWFNGTVGLTTTSWANSGYGAVTTPMTFSSPISVVTVSGKSACNIGFNTGSFQCNYTGTGRSFFAAYKLNTIPIDYAIISFINSGNEYYDFTAMMYNLRARTANLQLMSYGSGAFYADGAILNNLQVRQTTNPVVVGMNGSGISSTESRLCFNTGTLTNTETDLAVGLASTPTFTVNGQTSSISLTLCEILMYDGELTLTDFTNIKAYLNARWPPVA